MKIIIALAVGLLGLAAQSNAQAFEPQTAIVSQGAAITSLSHSELARHQAPTVVADAPSRSEQEKSLGSDPRIHDLAMIIYRVMKRDEPHYGCAYLRYAIDGPGKSESLDCVNDDDQWTKLSFKGSPFSWYDCTRGEFSLVYRPQIGRAKSCAQYEDNGSSFSSSGLASGEDAVSLAAMWMEDNYGARRIPD